MVGYPYRELPVIICHVAPLYAVWNAGPKLTADKIPEIARHFCEFSGDDTPTQPTRVEEIKSRLDLVAEIWKMITGVQAHAISWGKVKNGKRKYPEDLTSDSRSARPSSSQTPAPSTRASTLVLRPKKSALSAAPSHLRTRSQKSIPGTPTTQSPKPAKSRKIASANRPKGKGRGKGNGKGKSGNPHGAGREGETLASRSDGASLTTKALRLHNKLLHAPSNGSLHYVQRWVAKTPNTPADFVEQEQLPSKVEYTPTDEKSAKVTLTLTRVVERTPAEVQCTPTDVLDQRPTKVMPTDGEQKPAEMILTPTGVVEQTPVGAQYTPTDVLDQWVGEVMPTDFVEQKPAEAEYTPTDEKLSEVILTASGAVDQTLAEAQRTPTEVVNHRPTKVTTTDVVEQGSAKMQYTSTDIGQKPAKAPPAPTDQQRPATPRGRRRNAPEVISAPGNPKRVRSLPPAPQSLPRNPLSNGTGLRI